MGFFRFGVSKDKRKFKKATYGFSHLVPIGSMVLLYIYIYGNIYHLYAPNVSIYTSTMDPMGYDLLSAQGMELK